MKNRPDDFKYYYIPMGISWSKKNKWYVRRTNFAEKDQYFQFFEDALDYCNELYADKRPPITLDMLHNPYETNTDQLPPDKRDQSTINDVDENVKTLFCVVHQLREQVEINNNLIARYLEQKWNEE